MRIYNSKFFVAYATIAFFAASSCGGGGGESSSKKTSASSTPVAAPTSSTSTSVENSGVTATTSVQTVEAIDSVPPVLTWTNGGESLSFNSSQIFSENYIAISDQATTVSYEFITTESNCLSLTWFDEISIDSVTGELRAKPVSGVTGDCSLKVRALTEGVAVTKDVTITIASTVSLDSLPDSITVNEDEIISGVTLSPVSSLASPLFSFSLNLDESSCDEHSFSSSFNLDSSTGVVTGTPSMGGSCDFSVTVSDSENIATKVITLLITEVDDPLLFESGVSAVVEEKGVSFTEVINFSDEDDSPIYSLDLANMDCDEMSWSEPLQISSTTGLLSGASSFTGSCLIKINVNAGSNSDSHSIAFTSQDTQAPVAISSFSLSSSLSSPSSVSTPSFEVEVSENEGAIRLYSDASCSVFVEEFSVSSLSQILTVSTPMVDGSYTYSVLHLDSALNSSDCSSTTVSYTVDTTSPEAPTDVVMQAYTNSLKGSQISFSSSVSSDVASYSIKLEDDSQNVLIDWAPVSGNSYLSSSDLALIECSVGYRYLLKAVDHAGNESTELVSSYFYFDVTAPGLVSSISNLANTEVSASEEHSFIDASDSCSGISHYMIAVSSSALETDVLPGWEYQTVSTDPYRIYTSESLSTGIMYYSLIKAVDGAGNVGGVIASDPWQLPGPPSAVDSVTIISKTTNSMELGWNEPANGGRAITDYLVEYKESASSDWLEYDDGFSNDIVLTVSGLNPDTSYDFRVTSWNGNYAPNPSPAATDSTFVDIPFFEPNVYRLMNIGGATQSSVVAFDDATEVKLDGVVVANLNAGELYQFSSSLNQMLEANNPIFAAGRVTGVDGNNRDGNVIWSGKDLAGKDFVFTLTRSAPHFLGIYSFEANNDIVLKAPNPANDITITMQDGEYQSFDLPDVGGFTIQSSGLLIAYTYSHQNANYVVDPKPILPASTDIIGIPSTRVKYTTNSASASVNYYHGNDNSGSVNISTGTASNITGIGKFSGTNSQYRAEPLRLISTEPLVANSNADSDGYCSAPFVPTVLMRKRFAINVSAQYVAFVSIYDATITAHFPDGTTSVVPLTRTGSNELSPYSAYFENLPAGTRFESDKRVQGYYEPNTFNFGSKDDETLLIGYD